MTLKIEATNVFKRNMASKAAIIANEGGARSSKSYSIIQLFIVKLVSETGKNFLITRKTLPSLRSTTYRVFISLLDQYKIPYVWNKSENTVKVNKNYVLLTGIVQVVCGLAIIGGVLSRVAALILLAVMLVATYVSIGKHHEPFLSTPEGKGWDINFLLMGSLVALIFLGDGKWSLVGW